MCPVAERALEPRPGLYLGPSKHLNLHFFAFPETFDLIAIWGILKFIYFLISKQL